MLFKEIEPNLRGCITKGIRDSFKRSTKYQNILKSKRIEQVRYKKDGTPSKMPQVFYKCDQCSKLNKSTSVQVDHIKPVVPLNKALGDMSLNDYGYRVFNLDCQLLCTTCHKSKTKIENSQRRKHKKASKAV